MATTYTESPSNFCEIESFVETEISEIKSIFFCLLYTSPSPRD